MGLGGGGGGGGGVCGHLPLQLLGAGAGQEVVLQLRRRGAAAHRLQLLPAQLLKAGVPGDVVVSFPGRTRWLTLSQTCE